MIRGFRDLGFSDSEVTGGLVFFGDSGFYSSGFVVGVRARALMLYR